METMSILLLGFIFNLLIARCTKYKYISLPVTTFFSPVCSGGTAGGRIPAWMLVLIGGFLLGWSAISPAIGQRYTKQVTEDGGIAMGHFGSLGYYISAWIASKTGQPGELFSPIPKSLRNGVCAIPRSLPIVMFVIYFVQVACRMAPEYLRTITDQNMPIFLF